VRNDNFGEGVGKMISRTSNSNIKSNSKVRNKSKMKRIERRILGYWSEAYLYCPLCFSNLGRVIPDEIVFMDSIDAFGKCHNCRWPLLGLYEYEKYLDRRRSVENQFEITDNFSDFEKSVLKEEIELVSLRLYNTDRSIFRDVLAGVTHNESIISLGHLDNLLGRPLLR
jgi:hypothetical protein